MRSADRATDVNARQCAPVHTMVLASPGDPCGPWLADGLRQRGLPAVRLVSIDALVYSLSLTHRLSVEGHAETAIALPDAVVGPELQATVNRTEVLPLGHLATMRAADRDYAAGEIHALFTSILHSLPGRVVNRGGPQGLAGPVLSGCEWRALAAKAGLPVRHLRWSSSHSPLAEAGRPPGETIFVVGPAIVRQEGEGATKLPSAVAEGCSRLAELCGADLLSVDFELSGGRRLFTGACCTPDLRPGGAPLLEALARFLT